MPLILTDRGELLTAVTNERMEIGDGPFSGPEVGRSLVKGVEDCGGHSVPESADSGYTRFLRSSKKKSTDLLR